MARTGKTSTGGSDPRARTPTLLPRGGRTPNRVVRQHLSGKPVSGLGENRDGTGSRARREGEIGSEHDKNFSGREPPFGLWFIPVRLGPTAEAGNGISVVYRVDPVSLGLDTILRVPAVP